MATYNIHGGHNAIVPGASGCFSEVTEDRNVKNLVIAKLRSLGHTVYDCTDDAGTTSNANLGNIVAKCNAHNVDLDVSIHFNAFNGSAHGVEVLCYDGGTHGVANNILAAITALGFTNRGIKDGSWLYVLQHTRSQAILIECCFCDCAADAAKYSAESMATAIVKGITGKSVSGGGSSSGGSSSSSGSEQMYRIRKTWADAKSQVGAYRNLDNAKAECPKGYTVFDKDGKAVYSNAVVVNEQMYRIRKTWADVKSQVGAYRNLDSAKAECPKGYKVFDKDGKEVYNNPADPAPNTNTQLYRVRKSWADAKSQLGAYKILDNAKAECPQGYTVFDWNGKAIYTPPAPAPTPTPTPTPTPDPKPDNPPAPTPEDVSPIKGVSQEVFIAYVGQLAKADMKKTGILASVTIAQAILESAWGQSELSLKANNLFGMKAVLSGNTWSSEWDGKIYAKRSPEDDGNGNITQVLSDFRAYNTVSASLKDHSDYLNGAKNGSALRYAGLKGEKDYKKAIQLIKDGGYATDSKYVSKVCGIIEQYNLVTFDHEDDPVDIPSNDDIKDIKKDVTEIKGLLGTIIELINKIIGFFTKK